MTIPRKFGFPRRGGLALFFLCWIGCTDSNDAAREGQLRVIEPRLTFFPGYSQCQEEVPSPGRTISGPNCVGPREIGSSSYEAARGLTRALRSRLTQEENPARRNHIRGILGLVWQSRNGNTDHAIANLQSAAELDSENAAIWSDLGACFLARAQAEDDPLDLLRGLDFVEHSLAIEPKLPAALFNRALTLEKLHLPGLARKAWDDFLAADTHSGWAAEAQDHRDRNLLVSKGSWLRSREELQKVSEPEVFRSLVDRNREKARVWAEEEMLAAWARAEVKKQPEVAAKELALARRIGQALKELGGDRLLDDAVAAIDATATHPARRQLLASAHLAYADAAVLVEDRKFEQARPILAEALRLFGAESPFRWKASFLQQRCLYRSGKLGESIAFAKVLLEELPSGEVYPVIFGRVLWVMATALVAQGSQGSAEESYLRALPFFEAAGEPDSTIAVQTYLADVYSRMGDPEEAWRRNIDALRLLATRPNPKRLRLLLMGAAFDVAEQGELRAALLFGDAALAMAREQTAENPKATGPDAVATHLWHRAFFHRLLGQPELALADTSEARVWCDRVESEEDRKSLWPEILFEEARSLQKQPQEAVSRLSEAERLFRADQRYTHLPVVLQERAKARAALRDLSGAEADLGEAVEILERQRRNLERPPYQLAFFDRAGGVFDQWLALEMEKGAEPERLLEIAEQARSRVLLDWLFDLGEGAPSAALRRATRKPRPIAEILRSLPKEPLFVEYKVLPDRVLIWTIRAGEIGQQQFQMDSRALAASSEKFRSALASGSYPKQTAELIWRALLEPILDDLRDESQVIIVADGPLLGLPFAALKNPESGRFLVEDHGLIFTPSLESYAERAAPQAGDLRNSRFLVAVNPAFDAKKFDLNPLPQTSTEAEMISSRFLRLEVLQGNKATPSAIKSRLPDAEVFHFAGHALVNWRLPLRSKLILAPEPGQPGSGALEARDLLDLKLDRTRLVVLSACETAFGGKVSEEGVVGLVWPFLARRVPAVVGSLWSVTDDSTAELFDTFYQELATGRSPSEALQAAQLMKLVERRTFGWAAFELYRVNAANGTNSETLEN